MKLSSTNPMSSDGAVFIDKQSEHIAIIDELAAARSPADLCRRAVLAGMQRLGFERIGIWFLEDNGAWNIGTFGVDEAGQLSLIRNPGTICFGMVLSPFHCS